MCFKQETTTIILDKIVDSIQFQTNATLNESRSTRATVKTKTVRSKIKYLCNCGDKDCRKEYASLGSLNRHEDEMFNKNKGIEFKCPYKTDKRQCTKVFWTQRALYNHLCNHYNRWKCNARLQNSKKTKCDHKASNKYNISRFMFNI